MKAEDEYMENSESDDDLDSDTDSDEELESNDRMNYLDDVSTFSPKSWTPKSSFDISDIIAEEFGDEAGCISSTNNVNLLDPSSDSNIIFGESRNFDNNRVVSSGKPSNINDRENNNTHRDSNNTYFNRNLKETCSESSSRAPHHINMIGKSSFIHTVGRAEALEASHKVRRSFYV